jgi:Tfp pilus assembly protein PilF
MDGIRPAVLLLMAESARQCGRPHDSLRILRHGHELSPRNTALLNNLVHGLAQSSDTIEEARGLLPALLAAGATPSICDTAAAVFFRLRDMPQTEAYLKRALEGLSAGDPHWREIHLHAAEIKCALGQYARAENLLKAMEKVPPKAFSPDDEERITAVREKLRRR